MSTSTGLFIYHSALSTLYLTLQGSSVSKLEYEPDNFASFNTPLPPGPVKNWLDAYFNGNPLSQPPDLQMQGTAFQQNVSQIMLSIPYGETLTYGDVSDMLGSSPRAVGQACKRNFIAVIIPCHRIVARHSTGGYEGATEGHRLDRKIWLINHEQCK